MPHGPLHLLLDSTGLKLFGAGRVAGREARPGPPVLAELHLAFDADTGEIAASILTDNHANDAGLVPDLLRQVEGEIASVTADGAYDGEPVYQAVRAQATRATAHGRHSAALFGGARRPSRHAAEPTRPAHPAHPRQGRMAWQKVTGYGRRSLAETGTGRYKALIGPRLRPNSSAQQGEIATAVQVLNRMIRTAKPVSVRSA